MERTRECNSLKVGITEGRHAIMLENLFYLLCGLDTTYIKVGVKDKRYILLTDPGYPEQLILPFESLAINIRIFNKFILKSQYCSDTVRRIIGDFFETKVSRYLGRLVEYRKEVKNIETLAVSLKEDVEEFDEMKEVIDATRDTHGVEIINLLKERRDRTVHFLDLYDGIINPCVKKIREEIDSWVTEGLILSAGFMVRENEKLEGFDESAWTHRYVVVEENVPYFLVQSKEIIYNCGRIVNIGKGMFGNNALHGLTEEYEGLGLTALNNYLNTQFLESLRSGLEKEFSVMHKYVLLNDSAFYLDIFGELGNEIFLPTERTIIKMNAIRGSSLAEDFTFRISPVSLNEYVLKILNVHTQVVYKKRLSILQSLTSDYNPTLLRNFISPKTFSELEIIFRFLFTLTSISYYMNKFREFRFARIVVLIVDHFRFILHSGMSPVEVRSDMDYVVGSLRSRIKRWLREFYLTSERIYCVWAGFFDLCFEFLNMEYKSALTLEEIKMFEETLACSISRLKIELESNDGDHSLISFLEGVEWNNVFN